MRKVVGSTVRRHATISSNSSAGHTVCRRGLTASVEEITFCFSRRSQWTPCSTLAWSRSPARSRSGGNLSSNQKYQCGNSWGRLVQETRTICIAAAFRISPAVTILGVARPTALSLAFPFTLATSFSFATILPGLVFSHVQMYDSAIVPQTGQVRVDRVLGVASADFLWQGKKLRIDSVI